MNIPVIGFRGWDDSKPPTHFRLKKDKLAEYRSKRDSEKPEPRPGPYQDTPEHHFSTVLKKFNEQRAHSDGWFGRERTEEEIEREKEREKWKPEKPEPSPSPYPDTPERHFSSVLKKFNEQRARPHV